MTWMRLYHSSIIAFSLDLVFSNIMSKEIPAAGVKKHTNNMMPEKMKISCFNLLNVTRLCNIIADILSEKETR